MKLAIMQPYVFPYIGYFQLINAVDKFVLYDDVNFIKKGWINRNRILVNGQPFLFTVPIENVSQNKFICHTKVAADNYVKWRDRFLETLRLNYRNAPQYPHVKAIIEDVFQGNPELISQLAASSIRRVCDYLDISTEIINSSDHYDNGYLKAEERIIDICIREKASVYINMPGGSSLYSNTKFGEKGIELKFLSPLIKEYKQTATLFTSNLSILDVLMFCDKQTIINMLTECSF